LEILNNTCTILTKINVNFHFIHQTFFFETKTSTISLYNTFFCAQLGSPPIRNLSSKFSDGYIFFNALKGLKNSFSTSVTLESTLSFGVIGTLQVQDSMIHTIRTQTTYNQNTKNIQSEHKKHTIRTQKTYNQNTKNIQSEQKNIQSEHKKHTIRTQKTYNQNTKTYTIRTQNTYNQNTKHIQSEHKTHTIRTQKTYNQNTKIITILASPAHLRYGKHKKMYYRYQKFHSSCIKNP